MRPRFLVLVLSSALALVGGACNLNVNTDSADGSGGTSATDATELDEPASLEEDDNGGYSETDEEPMFGLESMEQYTEDEEVEDPTMTETDEEAAEAESGTEVYFVRIVWGNLELNAREKFEDGREDREFLNWSGSLAFSGDGELLLERAILFDRRDSIVDEEDPKLIEWISHTGPHIDGILAELIVTPGADSPTLTFETSTHTQVIDLGELDHYNEIVTLDEDGHGVAFTALRIDDDGCAEGFLEGKFHDHPKRNGGVFRGRVLSEQGELNGHIRGHYGVNDEGKKVLFGKYINHVGRFRGLLHGTYGDGAFDGDWAAKDGTLEGTLNGKYVTGAEVDSGFFQGFWEETCE